MGNAEKKKTLRELWEEKRKQDGLTDFENSDPFADVKKQLKDSPSMIDTSHPYFLASSLWDKDHADISRGTEAISDADDTLPGVSETSDNLNHGKVTSDEPAEEF